MMGSFSLLVFIFSFSAASSDFCNELQYNRALLGATVGIPSRYCWMLSCPQRSFHCSTSANNLLLTKLLLDCCKNLCLAMCAILKIYLFCTCFVSRIREEKEKDNPKSIPLTIIAKDVGTCAYVSVLELNRGLNPHHL